MDNKNITSFYQSLTKSKITVIESGENNSVKLANKKQPKKNWRIGEKINKYFGNLALDLYLSLKSLVYFIRYDIHRIRISKNIIKENDIDIVHAHNDIEDCRAEIIACKIAKVPFVAHLHSFGQTTSFDRLFNKYIGSFIYISKSVRKHHTKQGHPANKGNVIYNGVDINKFTRADEINEIKTALGITDDDYVVGIIGRIDWWKGHQYFIKAIDDVARKM